ncbi:MAG TPA: hypothetical protein VG328_23510 [Stellaceae bacterium]|jgi:hypothetical protein|nr:hypothetical protein [Stellaceae bacterium]
MTSSARIAANRRNAQKSTGPKTVEGKAAAAQNALRHGLTARHIVCREEREEDFAAFAAKLTATLAPADAVEEEMVKRIVLLTWRLRRTSRAERGIIDDDPSAKLGLYADWITRAFDYSAKQMTRLARYEVNLDRSLGRAYAMLERRQAARRGEHVPPPVTVLVEGVVSDAANPLDRRQKSENCETKPIRGITASAATRE